VEFAIERSSLETGEVLPLAVWSHIQHADC